jgi:hypothetical protein
MKKQKIVLITIMLSATIGGIGANKINRVLHIFYKVDSTNPVTALRLCTLTAPTAYTTDRSQATPEAPGIVQTTYYTTPVALFTCPTTTIYRAQ